MTLQIRGYAAQSASTPLTAHRFERRAPRADDLVIDILYCGVCHSDLHQARNEWHNSLYPLVPGHEIIGRVASVGEAVSGFAVGELVGVGCMVDSCRHCAACSEGLEQYCAEYPTLTYNGRDRHDGLPTFGGYSERIVVSARFVLRIPRGSIRRRRRRCCAPGSRPTRHCVTGRSVPAAGWRWSAWAASVTWA